MDIERLARLTLFSSDASSQCPRLITPQGESTHTTDLYDLPPFQYPSLDPKARTFRLLRMVPGKKHEPIRCELTEESLDSHPSYIALSYLWDQTDINAVSVQCNNAVLNVRPNLWAFLRRFRKRKAKGHLKLWVDAICINQNDVPERNQQVSKMRDIYSMASSVIVWLGEATQNEELAFLQLRYNLSVRYDTLTDALLELLNKPYWQRVWIIQEFVLARSAEIWCGGFTADYHTVNKFWPSSVWPYSMLETTSRAPPFWSLAMMKLQGSAAAPVFALRNMCPGAATDLDFDLETLLQSFPQSRSTIPHDKIYAFLGLVRPSISSTIPRIIPDYSRSIVEVYFDVLCSIQAYRHSDPAKTKHPSLDAFGPFLRTYLRVSRLQAVHHVLRHAPRACLHAYTFALSDLTVPALSFISTVTNIGPSRSAAAFSRSEEWRQWKDTDPNTLIVNPLLRNIDAMATPEADSVGINSRFGGAPVPAQAEDSYNILIQNMRSAIGQQPSPLGENLSERACDFVITGFESKCAFASDYTGKEIYLHMHYASFSGTGQVFGILEASQDTFDRLKTSDSAYPCQLWAFSGHNEHNNVLLLQEKADGTTLGFIGLGTFRDYRGVELPWS